MKRNQHFPGGRLMEKISYENLKLQIEEIVKLTLRLYFGLEERNLFWCNLLAQPGDGYIVEFLHDQISFLLKKDWVGTENLQKIAQTLNEQGWSKVTGFSAVGNEIFRIGSSLNWHENVRDRDINFEKIVLMIAFAAKLVDVPENVFGTSSKIANVSMEMRCETKIIEMSQIVANYLVRWAGGWLWTRDYLWGLLSDNGESLKRGATSPYDLRSKLLDKELPAILKSLTNPIRFIYE